MASVYVSGDDTKSLVQFKDNTSGYQLRDHTYYGDGCPNAWGTDGANGSDIPCTSTGRIVKDGNNENQKNGTYYHYQAASSGSGGSVTTDNTPVPDTFCPLVWQLPYSGMGGDYYDKSKSWRYLFGIYNITSSSQGTSKNMSYPLSYILSGDYHWLTGKLYIQNVKGIYWSNSNNNGTSTYHMNMWDVGIAHASASNKANGFTIRWI